MSWEIDKTKSVLFMGASHIEKGINPEYFPSAINIASGSERYMFTFLKLKKLLNANKHIDTLFLQFAPTDIQKNTDSKYFNKGEMSYFTPLYFPYFNDHEWSIYSKHYYSVLKFLIQKSLKIIPFDIHGFGDYKKNIGEFNRNKKASPSRKWLEAGHTINYFYLDQIIELCKKHKIKLNLAYMPMFNKEFYYDIDYFYNTYRNKYSNIRFLDFSDWDCPDSYRKDEHHLNNIGADNFTKYFKQNVKP